MTSKLISRLTRDHQKLAETYDREGNKRKAADEYAKAGNHQRAAELAAEIQDEPRLIRYSLHAYLGRLPPRTDDLDARQAGDLLASSGHFGAAIPLFELAGDYRRAASAALKLKEGGRAAQFYEKGRMWAEAAAHYEQASLFEEALRVLELEAKSLPRNRSGPSTRVQELGLKRAELLIQVGRSTAAVALLLQLPPSIRRAELLERSGRNTEAIEAYLGAGESDRALTLARKSPDMTRRVAEIHLRSGRPALAGQIFASLGLVREAAEAYEKAEDWWQAAYRWETVRETARAAESYRRAGQLKDAARCLAAAGQPLQAADLYVQAKDFGAAAALHAAEGGDLAAAVGLYVQANDADKALAILRRLPAQDPGYLKGVLLAAPKLIEQGRAEELLRLLSQAPAAGPRKPGETGGLLDRLYWEGRALEAHDQAAPARQRYEKILKLAPAHRDVTERLGRMEPPATTPMVLSPIGGLAVGQRLVNRYEILSELGKGGMGKVYKAKDLDLGEMVAIKTLLTPAEGGTGADEERLLREVQICRRVSHPNVVRVFDLGRFDGGVFVTMELLEGQTLDNVISPFETLPLSRVRFFLSEIAAGLQEAHALGIVHRDLKPSNVMVTEKRLKILDFGIARMSGGFDSRLTRTGFAFGSPMFMSPEQLMGEELDGRSDLYSLGIVAYAMIAGREPFIDENPAVLALRHLQEEPPDVRQLRPGLPEPWVAFLARLLAKKPADRYASAREVLAVLETLPVE